MLNIPKTIFILVISLSILSWLISVTMFFGMDSSPSSSTVIFLFQMAPYLEIFVCGLVNGFLAYKLAKKKSAFVIYAIVFWVVFAAILLIFEALLSLLYPPSTLNSITILK